MEREVLVIGGVEWGKEIFDRVARESLLDKGQDSGVSHVDTWGKDIRGPMGGGQQT